MPPPTNVRLDCARWLVENLRIALPTHQVEFFWPGDAVRRDAIWVGEITGDITYPVSSEGRRIRDDKFRVPLLFQATRGRGDDAADALNVGLAGAEDMLAEAHTLNDDIDGVVSALQGETYAQCMPSPSEGVWGYGRMDVEVHARLT